VNQSRREPQTSSTSKSFVSGINTVTMTKKNDAIAANIKNTYPPHQPFKIGKK
jgi:hypothetical protein